MSNDTKQNRRAGKDRHLAGSKRWSSPKYTQMTSKPESNRKPLLVRLKRFQLPKSACVGTQSAILPSSSLTSSSFFSLILSPPPCFEYVCGRDGAGVHRRPLHNLEVCRIRHRTCCLQCIDSISIDSVAMLK